MKNVAYRITEYLSKGGMFNPELMDHSLVRELLIDARVEVNRLGAELDTALYRIEVLEGRSAR